MQTDYRGELQDHLQSNFHLSQDEAKRLIKDHSNYVRKAEKKDSNIISVAAEILDRSGLR